MDDPLADGPLVDCHVHVFDPQRFPYAADAVYRPAGAEIGTAAMLGQVHDAHGIRHALIVAPTSGYGLDNRCLLDALAQGAGRYKGIALVRHDASRTELQDLQAAGVVGVALNVAMLGLPAFQDIAPLLQQLRDLGLWAQVQVQGDQLAALRPMLQDSGARLLFDHAGRPDPAQGPGQAGFAALLALAETGRACIKLSGHDKFSAQAAPWRDTWPCLQALIQACGPHALVWASDWPFLRARQRLDIGPLLALFKTLVPDLAMRRAIGWHTPRRLFGWQDTAG